MLAKQQGWGRPLCSTGILSFKSEFPLLRAPQIFRQKGRQHIDAEVPIGPNVVTPILLPTNSTSPLPLLLWSNHNSSCLWHERHVFLQFTVIKASTFTHTVRNKIFMWTDGGVSDIFMSPIALHCLFVTFVGYESLKGQLVVKWLLPWRGGRQ